MGSILARRICLGLRRSGYLIFMMGSVRLWRDGQIHHMKLREWTGIAGSAINGTIPHARIRLMVIDMQGRTWISSKMRW